MLPYYCKSVAKIQYIRLNIVTCRTYLDKFIRNRVVAPCVLLSVVIVTLSSELQQETATGCEQTEHRHVRRRHNRPAGSQWCRQNHHDVYADWLVLCCSLKLFEINHGQVNTNTKKFLSDLKMQFLRVNVAYVSLYARYSG